MLPRKILPVLFLLLYSPLKAADDLPLQLNLNQPMTGIGRLYHPVSTKSAAAQQFFNQGLSLLYAYNYLGARISFENAAKEDPMLAMAYWGMALSLGSNINMESSPQMQAQAAQYMEKAVSLSQQASSNEQAYIEALSKRYEMQVNPKERALNYKEAMGKVVEQFPDDLDAATLYAESSLDLQPWSIWTPQGEPMDGNTLELVSTLERVLIRQPGHLGANHFYIHATEASKHPEYGLPSATRLLDMAPGLSHIVHMPSHVYFRLGNFQGSVECNERAIATDEAYSKANKMPLRYSLHYFGFLARSYCMEGSYAGGQKSIRMIETHLNAQMEKMDKEPAMYTCVLPSILLRFHRWQDIIETPSPSPKFKIAAIFWHYARCIAFSSLGEVESAKKEHALFLKQKNQLSKEALYGSNKAQDIFEIASLLIDAKFSQMAKQNAEAIASLQKAVELQDRLEYSDPPDWFYPIRESLGAALYRDGKYFEASQVFRHSLMFEQPLNGRALFGLKQCLMAQNKQEEEFWVEEEFKAAWKYADINLTMEEIL